MDSRKPVSTSWLPAARDARTIFFDHVQRYANAQLEKAQTVVDDIIKLIDCLRLQKKEEAIQTERSRLESAKGRLEWLQTVSRTLTEPMPRARLAYTPTWSFAGDLKETARAIEAFVSKTVSTGRGTKEDLKMVYVSNPPRHGKSLLLDNIFPNGTDVCVLTTTYNAASSIPVETYSSAKCALSGLYHRLLRGLLFF